MAARPRKPRARPWAQERGQAFEVADVRVDRLGRRGQPRRARGDHDPAARPVQARVVPYAQLGAQVGLAERDAAQGGVGGGDREGVLDAERRFEQRVQGGTPLRRAGRPLRDATTSAGDVDLGQPQAGERRGGRRGPRGPAAGERAVEGVDPDVDRDRLDGSESSSAVAAQRVLLAVRGDRVLQVDHHHVGPGDERLGDHLRAVAGDVQPGQGDGARRRGRSQRALRRAGPSISGPVRPSSARTASVSAPCGRPAQRMAPGVSESRKRTFCIRTVPSSGSSTSVIGAERRVLRVGHHVADVVDRARPPPRPSRRRRPPRRGRAGRSSRRPPRRARRRAAARSAPVANHGSSMSSGRPTRRITRSAMDWAEVETATQEPSAVR